MEKKNILLFVPILLDKCTKLLLFIVHFKIQCTGSPKISLNYYKPKNNETTDFIKMSLILRHPVHGMLNMTSESDLATSNYYTGCFFSVPKCF